MLLAWMKEASRLHVLRVSLKNYLLKSLYIIVTSNTSGSFHENQLMVSIGGLGFVFGFLGFPYERGGNYAKKNSNRKRQQLTQTTTLPLISWEKHLQSLRSRSFQTFFPPLNKGKIWLLTVLNTIVFRWLKLATLCHNFSKMNNTQ